MPAGFKLRPRTGNGRRITIEAPRAKKEDESTRPAAAEVPTVGRDAGAGGRDVARNCALIVGLGNPGRANTNGPVTTSDSVVVDEVARRLGVDRWRKKDGAQQAHVAAHRVVLVKPLTYMNESGYPVRGSRLVEGPAREMLVVSDDLDLPFGRLRMRQGGGSGGHNGLKS